ncbi:hypothetical protein HZC20_00140 [Candidatus Peregrinibacteria bacterium]|nr:hypothetical protein [Candidatus Peregrinibacteria bacterium]
MCFSKIFPKKYLTSIISILVFLAVLLSGIIYSLVHKTPEDISPVIFKLSGNGAPAVNPSGNKVPDKAPNVAPPTTPPPSKVKTK